MAPLIARSLGSLLGRTHIVAEWLQHADACRYFARFRGRAWSTHGMLSPPTRALRRPRAFQAHHNRIVVTVRAFDRWFAASFSSNAGLRAEDFLMNGSPPRPPQASNPSGSPHPAPPRGHDPRNAELLGGVGKTMYEFSGSAAARPGDAGDPSSSRTLYADRDLALAVHDRPQDSNLRAGKGTGLIFLALIVVLGGGITFGLVAMSDDQAASPAAAASTSTAAPAATATNAVVPTSTAPAVGTTTAPAGTTAGVANQIPVQPDTKPAQDVVPKENTKPSGSSSTKKPSTGSKTPTKDPPKKDPPQTPSTGLKPKKPPKKKGGIEELPDPEL